MAHTHQVDPPNTATASAGSHTHNVSLFDSNVPTTGGSSSSHSVSQAGTSSNGSHTHNVNIPAFTSNWSSVSNTDRSNPPYLVVNYIIKT